MLFESVHVVVDFQERFLRHKQKQAGLLSNFLLTRQAVFFSIILKDFLIRKRRVFKNRIDHLINKACSKMKLSSSLIVILGAVALANCEVFFEEKFLDGKRKCRNCCWVLAGDDGGSLRKLLVVS